ncbi:hypothetical protein [Methylomagnum sp.]
MNNPYEIDFTRQAAAQYLAALCGIDILNFTYPGRIGDLDRYGKRVVLQNCTFLNFFRGAEPGQWGQDLKERTLEGYSPRNWAKRFDIMNEDFFKHKYQARSLYSPLHDRELLILGGVLQHRFQILICCDESELSFLFLLGKNAYGIYYPSKNLFLNLDVYMEKNEGVLNAFLTWFLTRPREFAAWVTLARSGRLWRAFIIGDNRPGHYIRQSLAYIDKNLDDLILPFIGKGGLIAIVRDWCFMDPLTILPELNAANLLLLTSKDAAESMLGLGLDVHRVYRHSTYKDSEWLRHRLEMSRLRELDKRRRLQVNEARPDKHHRFKLLISIDSEKQRVLNQVEVFRFVLQKLGLACREHGLQLEVVWDGWTVAHDISPKDIQVIDNIERIIVDILHDFDMPLSQVQIYGRSAEAKIDEVQDCDLVIVTQGTGAVIPCWLLQRPTIIYHVAGAVSDRSCLDERYVYDINSGAILPDSDSAALVFHERRFSIALWGMEEALIRAAGNKLSIKQELQWVTEDAMDA